MKDLVGVKIGRYEIQAKIGEGGMAMVYRAYDARLKRDVALKVIHASNAQQERFFKRFEREVRAMAVLTHPGIVQIYDVGDYNGLPYLVMEYLPGGTLKRYLGRPMAWQEAVSMLLPVSDALSFAHKQGIIHRDVKPSNILLDGMGKTRLSDFGIAKFMDQKETMELTGTNLGVGTPEYMAPEQGLGQDLDARADIYALATVCFELVTGQKPFHGSEALAILVRKINEPPPHAADVLHGLSDLLDQTLYKAMASKPEARYATMASFGASLSWVLGKSDGNVAMEVPETQYKEQATQDFDLLSPESLELALEGYREKLAEMIDSIPALQEQAQEAFARKDWNKVQEISEKIKVSENSQATYQEMIARLSLISELRKQGDEAIESGQWDGVDTIIIRLSELGQTGERYAQILKKGLQQAQQESIEQISQEIADHFQKQDWLAVETLLAQLHDVGPSAEKMHAGLQDRYQTARRAVEQQRAEIQRLTKLASEALDEADWARADAAIIALNRLGAEGQQAVRPLAERLAAKRQGMEERDAHARRLIAQVETAINSEDWVQAESALTELRQMDPKVWAARVEDLAGELEAQKTWAVRREQEKAEAALAAEHKRAEILRLSALILEAITVENWQDVENGLASLKGLGEDGQREAVKLAEQLAKTRREAAARERQAAEVAVKEAEIREEQARPAVATVSAQPEIIQKPEAASVTAAKQETVAAQAQKRDKKPSGLIKMLLPVGAGLLAVAAAVVLLGNHGSLPAAMEEIPAVVVMDTKTATATQVPTHTKTPMPTVTFTEVPTETPMTSPTPITKKSEKDGMEMVFVPSGEFIMGEDSGGADEKPAHIVYLDAYWIDKYEVTNVQYTLCVADGNCGEPKPSSTNQYSKSIYGNHPVGYVSWKNAQEYCAWAGRRLLSEAEWEKAARGTDFTMYPWGNDIPNVSLLNYKSNEGGTTNVGSFPEGASPYGAMDMAGNAWEWVLDWYGYEYYSLSPLANPTGPSSGTYVVLRGGDFDSGEEFVRSAFRLNKNPNYRGPGVGFRCAVDASPDEISQYSVSELTSTLTPTPALELTIGSTRISEIDGMEMVYVPAGEFIMGSDDRQAQELVHLVYLDGYWIDKYEVSNSQYSVCVADGTCDEPNGIDYYDDPSYANHPVVNVSWFDAQDYCQWADRRLPSEAEWEKAARGTDERTYPWGEQFPNRILTNFDNNEGGTMPVGTYPEGSSPYGAMDMMGNVWEWTADWYDENYYSVSPNENPVGPSSGDERVLRGGSWGGSEWSVRVAYRYGRDPDYSVSNGGFRCASSEPAQEQ